MPYESCDISSISKYSWDCNDVTDSVIHYQISNLMHCWPNVNGNDDCPDPYNVSTTCLGLDGYCNTCFDATPVITDWLQRFSLTPNSAFSDSSESPGLEL